MEHIEVVFMQPIQKIENSLNSEELPSCVQHEASVGIEIKCHGTGLAIRTAPQSEEGQE
jgi:hypothetical protein